MYNDTTNGISETQVNKVQEWSWSECNTTVTGEENLINKQVNHFAADEKEFLANRANQNGLEDDSDSENDDNDNLIFEDMQLFFHAIGEPQLIDNFLKNKVTLGQLLEFDEQDLINCGVELVGDRKKILANTGQMHCEKWQPASLHDLTAKSLLSSPGIYITLNDINKHLEYIGVTFRYLKRKLQKQPQLLELGKDYVNVEKVVSEVDDLIKTSRSTHTQAQYLRRELGKHLNDPTLKPANHIDKNYLRNAKIRQYLPSLIVATMTVAFSIRISKYFNGLY